MKTGTIEDMLFRKPTDITKNGKCCQCGECCSNLLPMSEREIRRIHHYIKRHKIAAVEHVKTGDMTYDGVCPFCDMTKPDKKCRIYKVRPNICKRFICSDLNGHRCGGPESERTKYCEVCGKK